MTRFVCGMIAAIVLAAAPAAADPRAEWLYEYAGDLYEKQAPRAEALLETFRRDYPDDARVSIVLYRLSRLKEAGGETAAGWELRGRALKILSAESDDAVRESLLGAILAEAGQAGDSGWIRMARTDTNLRTSAHFNKLHLDEALRAWLDGDSSAAAAALARIQPGARGVDPHLKAFLGAAIHRARGETEAAYAELGAAIPADHPLAADHLRLEVLVSHAAGRHAAALRAAARLRNDLRETWPPEIERIHAVSLLKTGDYDRAFEDAFRAYIAGGGEFFGAIFLEAIDSVSARPLESNEAAILAWIGAHRSDSLARDAALLLLARLDFLARDETLKRYVKSLWMFADDLTERTAALAVPLMEARAEDALVIFLVEALPESLRGPYRYASASARHRLGDYAGAWTEVMELFGGADTAGATHAGEPASADRHGATHASPLLALVVLRDEPSLRTPENLAVLLSGLAASDLDPDAVRLFSTWVLAIDDEALWRRLHDRPMDSDGHQDARDRAFLEKIAGAAETDDRETLEKIGRAIGGGFKSTELSRSWTAAIFRSDFRRGNHEAILDALTPRVGVSEEWWKTRPDSARLIFMGGEAARQLGRTEAAGAFFAAYLENGADSRLLFLARSTLLELALRDAEAYNRAVELLAEIRAGEWIPDDEERAKLDYTEGALATAAGDVERALAIWRGLIARGGQTWGGRRAAEMIELYETGGSADDAY